MLKWTVIARRETDPLRHGTATLPTANKDSTPSRSKRRRSSTHRHSGATRRFVGPNRNSLASELDKENQFTSTPIKTYDDLHQIDVLRDVSNLTPKDTANRRVLQTKTTKAKQPENKANNENILSPNKKKFTRKKPCVNPIHFREFVDDGNLSSDYFKNTESVDSHIKGLLDDVPDFPCKCSETKDNRNGKLKRRMPDTYAPTLPTFVADYSPCPMRTTHCLQTLNSVSPSRVTPLSKLITSQLEEDSNYPPNKRPKIDHVNDFLHQISFLTSPEPTHLDYATYVKECPSDNNNIKMSPLVKKMVDLKFSNKPNCDNDKIDKLNDSSYINDLSLDKIIDVLLDSPENGREKIDNTSILVNVDEELHSLQRDNDFNESQEDNLINIEHERRAFESTNSFDRCSSDSGFRSSATENSHQLDVNFTCKCNSKRHKYNLRSLANERTLINLEETFNERCVDDLATNIRKRRSSASLDDEDRTKRISLDKSDTDGGNFTLKRQRCIRRKKGTGDNIANTLISFSGNSYPRLPITDRLLNASTDVNNDETSSNRSFASYNVSELIDDRELVRNCARQRIPTPIFSGRRTRRCLLFDSPSYEDRSSISESSVSTTRSLLDVRGSMELKIYQEDDSLIVNIIRCKDLYRPNGKQINAYVKVALSDETGYLKKKLSGNLRRTAVQADSSNPFFNYVFKFPLSRDEDSKRLQIEVWHRERSTRTSEFLGCMSFAIQNGCEEEISGSYRLLPQSVGRCQNAPITLDYNQSSDICKNEKESQHLASMCESQSSIDDIMSLEDVENELKKTTNRALLSEQQKHADENLFLRYLELDPVEGPDAASAATQRKATGMKNGRTPFTQTKKLVKGPKSGFGFSVVWTHPPRIERVEKGLPADKAGILPGDYIIFVDKHNVVMMPEIDILNLIRSCGSQLTLEIFRRNTSRNGSVPSVIRLNSAGTASTTGLPLASNLVQRRPSTVCSTNTTSVDYNRRKLHLPQVTFSAEKPSANQEDNRRRAMYQLISKEQQYATALQFAVTRFVSALNERRDLITPSEHRTLFQNSEEVLRVTEDILDHVVNEDGEPHLSQLITTYHAKLNEITSVYRRYCSGIKRADCVLANKTKNSNSEFVRFLQTPSIPRRRPDITTFIHKPLEHYREVLKLLSVIQSYTKPNHEDYSVINQVVNTLQSTYREITVESGLMEPMGEGRPLLTVQDLESRLVFTKCKPFPLNKPGRQWIFGGDLSRIEGRNVRQYWTLLFSDLLLFAKVSRDRVLFITEDPIPLVNISDMFFNIRKKDTEFRITISPGGRAAKSPTVHCGPDLTRTPRKNSSKRTVILRAPTIEMKAVWQNLLQRQIFQVNTSMDGSSFSSPLESPDAPITSSVATLQSAESLSLRRQVRLCSGHCSESVVNSSPHASHSALRQNPSHTPTPLTKTPDTPSANISSPTSEQSQAFTSHFTSESSLLPKQSVPEEPNSPSAILTPSTEISSDTEAQYSEDIDFLKFDEDPWDISNFDYDLSSLNVDDTSSKSCYSN